MLRRIIPSIVLTVVAAAATALAAPASVSVDATEAPRKIFHARLVLPASPGPLTLLYPKWLPGEHGPTGPIVDLAGVKIAAAGRAIPWRRDPSEMYAFHLDVPQGASQIEVALDYLSPAETEGFSSSASASSRLALVSWNQLVVYPQGAKPDEYPIDASLHLPEGWSYATALPVDHASGGAVAFKTATLTTLVDSPVLTGAFMKATPLGAIDGANVELDVAAESAAALAMTPETEAALRKLVAEAGALFGARHFREYHFLYTLSDEVAHFGLEHHESSDDRVHERTFLDEEPRLLHAGLLPHEFVHSWNGKYRRPAGLKPGLFDQPMDGSLLWVYEGLTQYLGNVLTGRSGLRSPDQWRDDLAATAAELDHEPGRTWRPLSDTAVAAQILYGAKDAWFSWRRGVDFYDESNLIWLEADVLIRRESRGARSLDDFCKRFHGAPSGSPAVKTYTMDDVVAGLNEILPYDWKGFLTQRLETTAPHAPLAGLEGGGWKLAYTGALPERLKFDEKLNKNTDVRYSLGFKMKDEGEIIDVVEGSPAARAGLGPGMKVIAVNGRKMSKDVLREAIAAGKGSAAPIEILAENGEYFRTYALDWHEGEKYPHLERDASKPDLLAEIIKPKSGK